MHLHDVLQDCKAAQASNLLVQGAVLQTSASVYNDGADAKENIVALVRVRVRVRCRTRCAHRRTGFLPGAAEKAKKC